MIRQLLTNMSRTKHVEAARTSKQQKSGIEIDKISIWKTNKYQPYQTWMKTISVLRHEIRVYIAE